MTTQKVMYAKFLQDLREMQDYEHLMEQMNTTSASLEDIFEVVWSHTLTEKILKIPPGNFNINKKSQPESEGFRNAGNRLYKDRNLDKALLAYNYAILSAPHPKESFTKNKVVNNDLNLDPNCEYEGYECLAFAYANRSIVLVDLEQYNKALKDIYFSFKYGYPEAKRYKLVERKIKCFLALNKHKEAKYLLDKLSTAVNDLKLDKKEMNSLENNIKKLTTKYDDLKSMSEEKENASVPFPSSEAEKYFKIFYRGPETVPDVSTPRENYPTISEAIMVKYSPTKGRHLVASRDIDPGEILLVEESYCNTINIGDGLRSYCNQCMKSAPIPLPCSGCSLVVFCSEDCRVRSLEDGGCHEAECSILPRLVAMDPDIDAMLVFRSVFPLPAKFIQTKYEEVSFSLSNEKNTPNALLDSIINNEVDVDMSEAVFTQSSNDNFLFLCNLEGNIRKRNPEEVFEASVAAVLLTKLYLTKKDNMSNSKILGGVILRLLLNFQCNAHCIKELQRETNELAILSTLAIIGYGVFCNLSLVNHACNPNVLHSTSGSKKFMYAITCITKGEEINDSYGERFVSHKLKDRQESLEKTYHFQCDCRACNQDWPLFDKLPYKFLLKCFKCSTALDTVSSKCLVCKTYYGNSSKSDSSQESQLKQDNSPPPYNALDIRKQISIAWDEYNALAVNLNKGTVPNNDDLNKLKEINILLSKYSVVPNKPCIQVQEMLMRAYDLKASVALL